MSTDTIVDTIADTIADTSVDYIYNYGDNNVGHEINNEIEIKNSRAGYDSTMAPFFRGYVDDNVDDIVCDSIIPDNNVNNIDTINKFIGVCKNKSVQDFYINNNGIDREIYIKHWTLLSLEKIVGLDSTYKDSGIENVVDLGYMYYGMGWVIVVFYYIKTGKLYFRMDGGSNGYDRKENFDKLKDLDNSIHDKIDRGIDFNEFISRIEKDIDMPQTVI